MDFLFSNSETIYGDIMLKLQGFANYITNPTDKYCWFHVINYLIIILQLLTGIVLIQQNI